MDILQTRQFIGNCRHAFDHIFTAIDAYNKILASAQKDVEEIERSMDMLSDLFMYRDQWSINANHHYVQYMERMKALDKRKQETTQDISARLEGALASIGATVDSMSSLAGTILQIAKQVLSLRHGPSKPRIGTARNIGSQSIVDVIWEGRNHAMHWDEGTPKPRVQAMLDLLKADFGVNIVIGSNNSLSILGILKWSSTDSVVKDLMLLI